MFCPSTRSTKKSMRFLFKRVESSYAYCWVYANSLEEAKAQVADDSFDYQDNYWLGDMIDYNDWSYDNYQDNGI